MMKTRHINMLFVDFQMRQFQTSASRQDIDQAAKYIGAGAATAGVAGSGTCRHGNDHAVNNPHTEGAACM